MPAWSGSTPIVWGDRVFLNVADDLKAQGINLHLWCVNRSSGTLLWQRPLGTGNHQERKQNMSTPSPVTDGSRVWVMTGTGHPEGVRLRRAASSGRATSRRTTAGSG